MPGRAFQTGVKLVPVCCIVYTADQSYLFPSLVSAVQARRYASAHLADIVIIGVDVDSRAQKDFSAICAAESIRFLAVSGESIGGGTAMMARLFLDRLLPGEYSRILYIDGDTQIVSSLDSLLETEPPAGTFLAVNDPMTFTLSGNRPDGRAFVRHARSIGLSDGQMKSYFNTGVLLINRDGWDATGQAAWRLIQQRGRAFRFPDQDPLNVVGADRHLSMSLAWNFPIFMCNVDVAPSINPAIYHYMSRPKPWQGGFLPWRGPGALPYREAVLRYPALERYHPGFPLWDRVRYHAQQRWKAVLEPITWGVGERRRQILQYERQFQRLAAE
jgi:lipopolysaccharide biosynthesis glycosyltransferase